MKSLKEIYSKWMIDKDDGYGDKGTMHSYIEIYDMLLKPYRTGSNVLEIGVSYGISLEMWYEYFVDSKIFGMDITTQKIEPMLNDPRFHIQIGDATKVESTNYYISNGIKFDVIIDDGSHMTYDQLTTYNIYKGLMKPGGIYIIEDIDNLDQVAHMFSGMDNTKHVEIYDLRPIKRRYDDALIVITDKPKV